jgi:hypothetical protein
MQLMRPVARVEPEASRFLPPGMAVLAVPEVPRHPQDSFLSPSAGRVEMVVAAARWESVEMAVPEVPRHPQE